MTSDRAWLEQASILPVIGVLVAVFAVGASAHGESIGENVARGKSYMLFPAPNYALCTDPGDKTQLTDGESTQNYFWTQRGTVGWQQSQYVTINVDLGKIEPIAGASMTTAAGTAGVTWPMAIYVLTSDDGKTWHNAGDLVALDQKKHGPWPEKYAIRRLSTDELRTRGRFVQFVVVPLPGAPYFFTDEVEVFRGPAELAKREPAGPATTAKEIYEQGRLARSIRNRLSLDADAIAQAVRQARVPKQEQDRLLGEVEATRREFESRDLPSGDSFRCVLPLNAVHAKLFQVQAALWRARGAPGLSLSRAATWDPLLVTCAPPDRSAPAQAVEVHSMRGEYRAAAVNLFNSSERPVEVRLCFPDLLGAPLPPYVALHEVQWTDTAQGIPVAAALPEARREGDCWLVTVPSGLVRQVWLTFHATNMKAGELRGTLVAQTVEQEPLRLPIHLRVWPLDFPKETTLWLGGWCYTNGRGSYGITPENRAAFLACLRDHFVNAPWANAGVMMPDQMSKRLIDTRAFDAWIADWPGARAYLVFLSVGHYSGTVAPTFAGLKIGTPEFDRAVGGWISAWVRHLRSKGIAPGQLGLLIHDEPHEGTDLRPFLAWAKAIRAAEPEVRIWLDPTYRDPRRAPAELFAACDILCPNRPMWLEGGKPFGQFYLDQKRQGRTLQFYSCSGPVKVLDPYSYYRLQAWHCWQVGGTGSFFWAFGDSGGASSWNEYFAKAGPFTPLFLDDKTVTAGKHMEAIRESVEDYEYFVLLKRAVDGAKAAGRADEAVQQAERLLTNGAREVLMADGASAISWRDPKDRAVADRVRLRILETLSRLK